MTRVIKVLDAAVQRDTSLSSKLAGEKVYLQRVAQDTPLSYITLVNPQQNNKFYFGSKARSGTLHINIHSLTEKSVLAIYDDLDRLVNDLILPFDDGTGKVYGTLRMVLNTVTPKEPAHQQGITAYEWETLP
jgi:hypothetical protein